MFKIISAKLAARETIKAQLAKEVTLLNDAIKEKMKKGETDLNYDGDVSKATAKLLEKSGFQVRDLYPLTGKITYISWNYMYNELCDDKKELVRIIEDELKIEIVCPAVTPKNNTD